MVSPGADGSDTAPATANQHSYCWIFDDVEFFSRQQAATS